MKAKISTLISLWAVTQIWAQQPMESGFTMLQNGHYEAAEIFFEEVLETEPNNKTAQICYGRAVGLKGAPQKAIAHFSELLSNYPADLEVQLNYNESLLWAGEYTRAKPLYKELLIDYPKNFNVLLGYANTLSNLKEYTNALVQIHKALTIAPGNPNALKSKKYILLGYANVKIQQQKFQEALVLLNSIFDDFPEDQETIANMANLYLKELKLDEAGNLYKRMANNTHDSIIALNGLALVAHLDKKDSEALRLTEAALKKLEDRHDHKLKEQVLERHLQALIWNGRYTKAKAMLKELSYKYKEQTWFISIRAMLGMYTGDTKNSIYYYRALIAKDSNSFDGNLGLANALLAADKTEAAYRAGLNTSKIFKGQNDVRTLMEKIDMMHLPTLSETASYSFDNGNNIAYTSITRAETSINTKFRANISYQYRKTENTQNNLAANTQQLRAGVAYKFFPKSKLKVTAGLNTAHYQDMSYTQPIFITKLQLQPYKLQNLELGYTREVQQFNADLIAREISMEHYGLSYHLGTNFRLGWYTQLLYTNQSDNNSRELLFSSIYYKLLKQPGLKLGINYQYFGFDQQRPNIYFSPESYQSGEVFTEAKGAIGSKTSYMLSVAGGLQQTESEKAMNIFRAEARIGTQFSKRLYAAVFGKYSNSASATVTGFTFTEIGLNMKWNLTKSPIFSIK